MKYQPPAFLRWLLEWALRDPYASPLLGDFQEAYHQQAEAAGRRHANRWLLVQLLRSLPAIIIRQFIWGTVMLRNYVHIALRNLNKYKGYTAINVVGLATGIACCMLILLFVREELEYDRFHEKGARIFRLTLGTNGDGTPTNANSSYLQGVVLRDEFAEVDEVVRFRKMGWNEKRVFAQQERRFYEANFFFADANVFRVFDFPLLEGDQHTALSEPFTIALSEEMAAKYFPDEPALGRTILLDPYNDGQFTEYRVTAVFREVPSASHIQFDFLASFSSQKEDLTRFGWGLEAVYTYLLLHENMDWQAVAAKLPAFVEKHRGPDNWYSLHLQPLFDIHIQSSLRAEPTPPGDMAYIYIFSAIAFFILILAAINFMNLATARSAQRAREVGVRKVLGAFRSQLIKQFLGEALLLSFLAALLALGMLQLLIPVLNDILGKSISIDIWEHVEIPLSMTALALITGVLAGSYPALVLSAFRPSDTLKSGKLTPGGWSVKLRKGLVVFQFSISIILLICTLIVSDQMAYVRGKNLGFDRQQIVISPINDQLREKFDNFRTFVLEDPHIQAMSASEQVPARAGNGSGYQLEGVAEEFGVTRYFVDEDFLPTYGVEVVAGRGFSRDFPADAQRAFLVNEALVAALGWSSPDSALGRAIEMQHGGNRYPGEVIGVIKNFHLFSFRESLRPLVVNIMPLGKMNFISFRITGGDAQPALAHLQKAWRSFAPDYPFEFYFLDGDFARLHRADRQLGQVFRYFSLLAVFVACLGLFGLAAFTAEQRTREIGVRKVLGASTRQIVLLLSREFARWVMIANIIAWPVGYGLMQRWLQDFQYRIAIDWTAFVAASLIALSIAVLTISIQTLRAALANPVHALRSE